MPRRQNPQERRKQNRLEQLGTQDFVCIGCGCTDYCTAEGHHVGGRHYDPHREYICANNHRQLTKAGRLHPQPIDGQPDAIESAAHYNFGASDLLILVAHMVEEFGHKVIHIASSSESLDENTRRDLTLAGRYLIALASFLNRLVERLKAHGDSLIEEASRRKQVIPRAS